MRVPFNGVINVDIRDSTPDWTPFEPPRAPEGGAERPLRRARRRRLLGDELRPQLAAPQNRYVYYPGNSPVPEWQAVNVKNRSFVIGALVDIPGSGAEGVIFAHGSRFGGHALYVKDNRLHYGNSVVGAEEQIITAGEELPTGEKLILSASFEKEGNEPICATGTLTLYHGDRKLGEGAIRTQLGAFAVAGAPLFVGRHGGEPVTDDYPGESPYAFIGGTIRQVTVDVSGEPYLDMERHAEMLLRSQ
jgi:hypothetical protein